MAKRHGPEFWREHVDNWCRSDLTQREYCAKASLTLVPVSVGKADTVGVARLRSPDGREIELPGSSVPLLVDFLKHLS